MVSLFVHLIEGDTPDARLAMIRSLTGPGSRPAKVFAALTPDSSYAPTDWLMGAGCNCCLPASHPRMRLLALASTAKGSCRVLIDAGRPAFADRLAAVLRTLPCQIRVNIITAPTTA